MMLGVVHVMSYFGSTSLCNLHRRRICTLYHPRVRSRRSQCRIPATRNAPRRNPARI